MAIKPRQRLSSSSVSCGNKVPPIRIFHKKIRHTADCWPHHNCEDQVRPTTYRSSFNACSFWWRGSRCGLTPLNAQNSNATKRNEWAGGVFALLGKTVYEVECKVWAKATIEGRENETAVSMTGMVALPVLAGKHAGGIAHRRLLSYAAMSARAISWAVSIGVWRLSRYEGVPTDKPPRFNLSRLPVEFVVIRYRRSCCAAMTNTSFFAELSKLLLDALVVTLSVEVLMYFLFVLVDNSSRSLCFIPICFNYVSSSRWLVQDFQSSPSWEVWMIATRQGATPLIRE